ncbi:uncharacterized protein OCT59_021038 [Rhizophagus irregularis]|uniref:uncharacterized protein n=1 Tax=Rhizophagus irregularis TaxID=588596 RepID=UPI003328D07E|nr:hypothetical protein OCT59_021038 [Rhizophagus irregularis]
MDKTLEKCLALLSFVNIFNSNYATTSLNSNISFTSKEKSVISRVFKRHYGKCR